ncbi:L-asparaginase 2 [Sutterella sp.]|uniref:L-asparaginase 2 n=1 Tax=Sutterella sp. TaxID=1981025 RepID=UPI0026DF36F9|nr:L-asparaginase 2 [Sutterella sp.]MDO5531333.1 L-asparaginase 2 [Sutterella sp.]
MKKTLIVAAIAAASSAAFALPNIAVLATGGTIAGAGATATGSAYTSGQVSVNHLVAAVPQIANIANVTPIQVAQIGSQDMSDEVWLKLAKSINADCSKYDGFVITHGTDTMEETAYFLQLTNRCKKPVVMVGAMLPSTGLSADGPRNLYQAVITAADPKTAEQGVVVAMNSVVIGARDVYKSSTTQPETFQAMNFGKVGTIINDKVTYEAVGLRAQLPAPFDVTNLNELPKVGIVYNHAGVEGHQAEALVKAGYKGIVSAGVGNGNVHKAVWPVLEKAALDGIVVVRSSRVPTGSTTKDAEVDDLKMHWVASQTLNPQKARVLLQLTLTKTADWKEVQKYFDQY